MPQRHSSEDGSTPRPSGSTPSHDKTPVIRQPGVLAARPRWPPARAGRRDPALQQHQPDDARAGEPRGGRGRVRALTQGRRAPSRRCGRPGPGRRPLAGAAGTAGNSAPILACNRANRSYERGNQHLGIVAIRAILRDWGGCSWHPSAAALVAPGSQNRLRPARHASS